MLFYWLQATITALKLMWFIQRYASFNPVQNSDGLFPCSLFAGIFNDPFLYCYCNMCMNIWDSMDRYCHALEKLETKVSVLNSESIWNELCQNPLLGRWVRKLCCKHRFHDFSLPPEFPVLQPSWSISQEVRFLWRSCMESYFSPLAVEEASGD